MAEFEIKQPTPEELRDLMKESGVPRGEIADMLHVGRKTVEKWTASLGTTSHRAIPLAAYELLLLKLGKHPSSRLLKNNT
jgi:DNA-binding transcriptional regulator YiaG